MSQCKFTWTRKEDNALVVYSAVYGTRSGFSSLAFVCIYRVQNIFLRCPTPRLHCFLSSHWPSFRFFSFMAFFIPSIQFFFGLPRAPFCFDIHFNAILGSLYSAILWTWPYHVSWFCSISFIIVSSSPICCLIVTFLILSFLRVTRFLNTESFLIWYSNFHTK